MSLLLTLNILSITLRDGRHILLLILSEFKGYALIFLLFSFWSLKKSTTLKLEKIFFISLQKFISFFRYSNFRIIKWILSFMVSSNPDNKTRNLGITVWQWNQSFTVITVWPDMFTEILPKYFTKNMVQKLVPDHFCLKRFNITSTGKYDCWNKLTIIDR